MANLLEQLKARRQQIIDRAYWTARLPRWDNPGVALRMKAAEYGQLDKAFRKIEAAKSADKRYAIQVAVVADHVMSIFLIDDGTDDATECSFDEVAEHLGVPPAPSHVVRALFPLEPDLIAFLNKWSEWAQQSAEQVDDRVIDGDDDEDGEQGN